MAGGLEVLGIGDDLPDPGRWSANLDDGPDGTVVGGGREPHNLALVQAGLFVGEQGG